MHEDNGNIVVSDGDGNIADLTTSGRDMYPALSPDGLRVLFLRRTADCDAGPDDACFHRDLYLVRVDTAAPELLLRDDPGRMVAPRDDPSPRLTIMSNPEWFPDGRRIAVSVPWGRGQAIIGVDLVTKRPTWITSVFGYGHLLVPRGPFAGDFVVTKHVYLDAPVPFAADQCWLVDGRAGKKKMKLDDVSPNCEETPALRAKLQY